MNSTNLAISYTFRKIVKKFKKKNKILSPSCFNGSNQSFAFYNYVKRAWSQIFFGFVKDKNDISLLDKIQDDEVLVEWKCSLEVTIQML